MFSFIVTPPGDLRPSTRRATSTCYVGYGDSPAAPSSALTRAGEDSFTGSGLSRALRSRLGARNDAGHALR